jgi:hypothetical protein
MLLASMNIIANYYNSKYLTSLLVLKRAIISDNLCLSVIGNY